MQQTSRSTPAWATAPDADDDTDLFDEQTTVTDVPLEGTLETLRDPEETVPLPAPPVVTPTGPLPPVLPRLPPAPEAHRPPSPPTGRAPIVFHRASLPGQPRLPPHVRWAAPAPRSPRAADADELAPPMSRRDVFAVVLVGSSLGVLAAAGALVASGAALP